MVRVLRKAGAYLTVDVVFSAVEAELVMLPVSTKSARLRCVTVGRTYGAKC